MRERGTETSEQTLARLADEASAAHAGALPLVVEEWYDDAIHRRRFLALRWSIGVGLVVLMGVVGAGIDSSLPFAANVAIGVAIGLVGASPFFVSAVTGTRQWTVLEPGGLRYTTYVRRAFASWDEITAADVDVKMTQSAGSWLSMTFCRFRLDLGLRGGRHVTIMRSLPFTDRAACTDLVRRIRHLADLDVPC